MISAEALKNFFYVMALSGLRMGALFAVLPFLGAQFLTPGVSGMVTVSLSWLLFPLVRDQLPATPLSQIANTGLFLKEVFLGGLIGFIVAIPFWITTSVGFLIDNQRGSSMAGGSDAIAGDESSPLGMILTRALLAVFLATGGLRGLIGLVYESYGFWPIFSFYPQLEASFLQLVLDRADYVAELIFLLAAPLSVILFLSDLGLGLMNRFTPQLNVFVLSMAVKSGLASFLLLFYLHTLFEFMGKEWMESVHFIRTLGRLLPP